MDGSRFGENVIEHHDPKIYASELYLETNAFNINILRNSRFKAC